MRTHLALRLAGFALLAFAAPPAAAQPSLPPGFEVGNALVNNTLFNNPTAIATLPDGRWLVAEKRGVVWVVNRGLKSAKPMWSATREVLNSGDRGLIGIAVDPDHARNRRVYFFYSVDPDSDDVDDAVPSFGRVTRYQTSLADSNVVDTTSRTVLIGAAWRDGIASPSLSHGADCLRFGEDGSLLVAHGDGAHYEWVDVGGRDSLQFLPGRSDPAEDLGSFRSQDLGSLAGKVLRINPETGYGYTSNPFFDGDLASVRSRVWALGFRNPFRFCVRPGTGSADTADARPGVLFVSDVGLNTWEEIDVVDRPGLNFGWPCREGRGIQPLYAAARPSRLGCDAPPAGGWTDPTVAWHHSDSTLSTPYGLMGNCAAGGLFYTAQRYPAQYHGRLFFADFGEGWLKVATLDSLHRIVQLQSFATALEGPVDWAIDPSSGDILYVSIYTGRVLRIRWTDTGAPPQPVVAHASATPTVGDAPTPVTFSSLGSYDPAGEAIACVWDFGDGTPVSTDPHPTHVYEASGEYPAVLTVTTASGRTARDTVAIVIAAASGFPFAGVLDSLAGPDRALAAPWAGSLAGIAVRQGALVQTASPSYATWSTTFGPNQEAYVTFDSVTASAPEHALLLKTQGVSWASGTLQVVYAASQSVVVVTSYAPGAGWVRRGGPWPVSFGRGDQLGARAFSNGMVVVLKNGAPIGTASAMGWPFAQAGGRIGLKLVGAVGSRLRDFGGGTVRVDLRTPPVAEILSPADRTFFVAGDRIVLRGVATDAEDPLSSLQYRWAVDLIHNNHTHPGVVNVASPVDSLVAEDHDDGTGVWYKANLFVTDPAGLSDTATVSLYPEIDLAVSPIAVTPAVPHVRGEAACSFTISNLGRMNAHLSRWALVLDGAVVAQGDTLVPALGAVRIERRLPALAAGPHLLRAVADTTARVVEPDEANNAAARTLEVTDFPRTATLDRFDRADGPLEAPWVGSLSGFAIRDRALTLTGTSHYAVWNGAVFGPDQEAWVRLDSITATAPEHDLLLKVQGTVWTAGAIQVVVSAPQGVVVVNTFTPGSGWQRRGGPWKAVFAPGDQLGARALADGSLRVYRNGQRIGETSLAGWPFAGRGGRIGILLRSAPSSRLTDFGGGGLAAPRVAIVAPAPSLGIAGEGWIALRGALPDGHDPAVPLRWRWAVDRAGASGAAERVHESSAAADSFHAAALEPGASYRVRLTVTDPLGLSDSATVTLHPEIDLVATPAATAPLEPRGVGVTTYAFTLANRGRVASPTFRWVLAAGATVVAQGDTAVAALDSVRIERTVASLPPGSHLLRVVADTLGMVPETDETNNAAARPLAVVEFPTTGAIDDFARADGPLSSPWVGSVAGLAVRDRALVQTATTTYVVWNGAVFGADQEAHVRFDSVTTTAPEHCLLLKVQGTAWTAGAIQVTYAAGPGTVVVNTYTPGTGWQRIAGPWKASFGPGDRLGARALADGSLRVFRNGTRIGEASLAAWPFATRGGRVGLLLHRAPATRIAVFGGGDFRPDSGAMSLWTRSTPRPQMGPHGTLAADAEPQAAAPRALALSSAYPNPARGAVAMRLELPRRAVVALEVFDLQGRRVWGEEREREAGRWVLSWPGTDAGGVSAAPGVYLARARVDGVRFDRRIVRVR